MYCFAYGVKLPRFGKRYIGHVQGVEYRLCAACQQKAINRRLKREAIDADIEAADVEEAKEEGGHR
jgi:hypothetical protein